MSGLRNILWRMGFVVIALCTALPAGAQNWTQTAGGTYSWNNSGNWDAAFPNVSAATANLTDNIGGDQTVNLGQAITVGTLNIGDADGSAAFTLANGGGSLTINNTWDAWLNQVASSKGDTISATMTLNNGGTMNIQNYSTNPLTLNGPILNGNGNNGFALYGGTVVLGGANTFAKAPYIYGGMAILTSTNGLGNSSSAAWMGGNGTSVSTLKLANDGTGNNGTVIFGSPNNPSGYSLLVKVPHTYTETIAVDHLSANTGNTMQLNNLTFNGNWQQTLAVTGANGYRLAFAGNTSIDGNGSSADLIAPMSADVTLNTVSWTSGGNFTLDGTTTGSVVAGTISGTGRVTKQNTSTWTLSGTNTYTGSTTINGGTLAVTSTNGLGDSTTAVTLGNGATLKLANDGSGNNGFILYSSPNNNPNGYNLSVAVTHLQTATVAVDHVSANTGNTIQLNNLTFSANVDQTLAVNGAHGYRLSAIGNTYISGSSSANRVSPISADITLNTVSGVSSYNFALGGTTTGSVVAGTISGSGTVTKQNASTWTLSGSNTFTGAANVQGGALRLSHAYALPGGIGASGGAAPLAFSGGVVELGTGDFLRGIGGGVNQVSWTTSGGGFAAVGGNRIVNIGGASAQINTSDGSTGAGYLNGTLMLNSATADSLVDFQNPIGQYGSPTLTVQVADNPNSATDLAKISGVISGGGLAVTKTGAGTLILSATNTYGGWTTVNSGTLLVNGANTGGNGVTVAGGVLGGTGAIAGTVTVNSQATITANDTNSIGTLSITNLTMAENSTYVWNYDATSNDVINVTGTLTLPTVATVNVSRVTGSTASLPGKGVLFSASTISGSVSNWVVTGAVASSHLTVVNNHQIQLATPTGWVMSVQ